MSDPQLLARLAETVAWCNALSEAELRHSKDTTEEALPEDAESLVCAVGKARQNRLRDRDGLHGEAPTVSGGRFMLYFPDENLCDGYAQLVSNGFFNVENLPVRDTWVSFFYEKDRAPHYERRYLLCYVPLAAMQAADTGIEGNPEACIVWLDQTDVALRDRVRAAISKP